MEKKNNIRSMRFSDRTIELIEQQAGENFTQKFEALVTRCVWELPEQEKKIAELKKEIERLKAEERKVYQRIRDMRQTTQDILPRVDALLIAIERNTQIYDV